MTDRKPDEVVDVYSSNPQALLAAIAASSEDAIVGKDLDGNITSWNKAAERLFGYTEAEMLGRSIMQIIPPARIGEEASILDRVARGERLTHFETERRTKDGHIIPVLLTISPMRDASGHIVGISKIARHVSEMQTLNHELQRRQALYEAILQTVPDALIVIDKHGIVQSFSPAAERMFSYSAAEVNGQNVSLLMPKSYAAGHDGYMHRYLDTGERRIIGIGRIVVARRKDGTTFPIELRVGEVSAPGTHLFAGFIRDLTERQERDRRLAELQSELIHVSRLSELGQMVSALAHEVNQPLTAITNYLSGIRRLRKPDAPPQLFQAIEKIAEQAERARDIIQSVRGLVRKESRARRVESLEAMVQETSALALIGTNRSVSLHLHVAAGATHAFIDKVQIQQVLLNLMRNAVEAMETSRLRKLTLTAVPRGDRVEIQVADTGPGLPELVRTQLFRPFVTTKAEGLGVGLSICRSIVEAHGGELIAESEAGHGTVFRFTVPGPGHTGNEATDLDQ